MTKPLQLAIAKTLGTREQMASVPKAPVLSDPIDVLKFVEMDCGADAFTFQQGQLVALRDNGDGTFAALKRYDVEGFGGRA